VAAQWDTYFLKPLAFGGAALLTARAEDAATLVPATAVRAFVGPVPAVSETDANPDLVSVDLAVGSDGTWWSHLWGAPRVSGLVVTWFCQIGGVWTLGPTVTGVDLTTQGSSEFPWVLDWIVDRLQEMAADLPLPGTKALAIRRTYPRDVTGWPMLSVQLDSLSPAAQFIGESQGVVGSSLNEGRIYSATLSLVGWTDKPEDRSRVGQWVAEAMDILLDLAPHAGMSEPSFTIEESEDFETVGVPAFLVNSRFTCQLESRRSIPVRSGFGFITV